ncbi:ABC transporter permease [Lichenibacterium ramalinae]|uniref:ABC transporter permease n=1 Tax=Lichenibacterium ramalinae TaxID=2316527 RepID=A0A4Q2R9T1_9HYPH|nr:ABC transporter permease [Lichenibacterium ramalinae]RYB02551.1 ABC transporter permease [Lichenibacterium ramalinae]
MARFLVSRLAQSLLLLVLVSVIGFGVLHLAPGGPMAQFALVPGMSQAQLAEIAHAMGLDQPLPLQYWQWFSRLLVGDWGHSYRDAQPVLAVIAARLPATLELMGAAIALAVLTGVTVGVLGAVRRDSAFDVLSTAGAMVALSIPTFWFGLVTIYVFSVKLGWLPAGSRATVGDASLWGYVHHLIAPACVLALVEVAVWSRYMRSAMLDVIDQDFVRTARAKGLPERRVVLHHVLRNAWLPMITLAGLELPTLLGGALVTETVFTWPGMGRLFLDSLGYRDYPVVMGILMVSALLVLIGSLMADLVGAVVDPRVRLD